MEVLSHSDGSAQAIKDAAAADDSRLGLERELDRLNAGLASHANGMAHHLNWMLVAQAFLLAAYLIVLIGAWSLPLPGKRWLLAGIAGFAAISLVLAYLGVRGSRDRVRLLRQSRRWVEQALERVAARPPLFSKERPLESLLAAGASRLLPLLILTGWSALTVYTLSLSLPGEPRGTVAGRVESPAASAPAPAPRARSTPRKAEEPVAAAGSSEATAESESPLASLFRRAINTPPAEQPEAVKP